ncbi:MAG: DUF4332 domain-containing protein [Thermoplasmatota archaeon]
MARSSAKRILGTLLFAVALVAIMAFLFLIFADAENLDDVPGVGEMDPVAIGFAIALGVIAILLLLLLLIRSYDKKEEDAGEAEAFFVPEEDVREQAAANEAAFQAAFDSSVPELVVYDLWTVQPQAKAWGNGNTPSYHFPRSVDAGVYANDYVDIAPGQRVKLRTLLAGPRDVPLIGSTPVEAPAEAEAADDVDDTIPAEEIASPGDDFMAELEARYDEMKDTGDFDNFEDLDEPEAAAPEVYYDYQGDVDPVIDIEGIGPVFAEKLKQVGVETTSRLCYEDADELAQRIGTEPKRVRTWQAMAELMKVSGIGGQYAEALARAGIEGISELKKRSPSAIAEQVNEYLEGLDSNVLGSKITPRRVEGWQAAAKELRRVRSKVPAA